MQKNILRLINGAVNITTMQLFTNNLLQKRNKTTNSNYILETTRTTSNIIDKK